MLMRTFFVLMHRIYSCIMTPFTLYPKHYQSIHYISFQTFTSFFQYFLSLLNFSSFHVISFFSKIFTITWSHCLGLLFSTSQLFLPNSFIDFNSFIHGKHPHQLHLLLYFSMKYYGRMYL